MNGQRNYRRCYVQCRDCHSFVIYDSHSAGLATRPGLCPVCRSVLNLRRFWRVGYVSRKECDAHCTSKTPFASPEGLMSLPEAHP